MTHEQPAGEFHFTSESVTEGHPDKMADQISDAVLDAILSEDPYGRVACETFVTTGLALVGGEITTSTYVDIPRVVREKIAEIGYTKAEYGFDSKTCSVIVAVDEQSPDIARGVDVSYEAQHDADDDPLDKLGAGDQGMMFGYACHETEELMPLPIMLAHKLTKRLSQVRREEVLDYLRPDGKSQVTVEYDGSRPARIEAVIISAQHSSLVKIETIREDILEKVIHAVIPSNLLDSKTKYFINPTGRFVVGGPQGDCGLTGRKIIVDTYGGVGSHGGGAFSGKDPTKVDRSASYMARYIAKNIVAAELADRVEIQIAYAIGVAEPVSVMADTAGTGKVPEDKIVAAIRETFPLTPKGIIEHLNLRRPIYKNTASYGHFGRNEADFTWERTDKADALRAFARH